MKVQIRLYKTAIDRISNALNNNVFSSNDFRYGVTASPFIINDILEWSCCLAVLVERKKARHAPREEEELLMAECLQTSRSQLRPCRSWILPQHFV